MLPAHQSEKERMRTSVWLTLFGLASLAAAAGAAEAPGMSQILDPKALPGSVNPNLAKRYMTITDCVQAALTQNLNISIERLTPMISAADVLTAEGIFDVNWVTSLKEEETDRPGGFQFLQGNVIQQDPLSTRTYTFEEGLGGLTPLGTKWNVGFEGNRLQSTSFDSSAGPQWQTFFGFQVTQPLAKGFGWDVNTTQIRLARKTQDISYQQFVQRVMDVVSTVKQAYYDMIYSIENVKVKEQSLDLAKRFLEESRKRMEVGTMARLDIVQAEAEVAQREGDLIDAQRALEVLQTNFKQLISSNVLPLRQVMIVPVDRASVVPTPIDPLGSMRLGLENRPEYLQRKLELERNHIQLKYYKNQLLPQVDLAASYGYGSLRQGGSSQDFSQFEKNWEDIGDGKFPSWSAGLTITVPLGNTTARGTYRHWKLAVEQALLGLKK
ncbi:MAG: TolC family protein, partial [Verrucomicrobia bacterium]|nr:TolC family protein [Verrucomicrobiota bacterium]